MTNKHDHIDVTRRTSYILGKYVHLSNSDSVCNFSSSFSKVGKLDFSFPSYTGVVLATLGFLVGFEGLGFLVGFGGLGFLVGLGGLGFLVGLGFFVGFGGLGALVGLGAFGFFAFASFSAAFFALSWAKEMEHKN